MAKKQNLFSCSNCGNQFVKWHGKCPACGEWNSIAESKPEPVGKRETAGAVNLGSISFNELTRIKCDIEEFNVVCGGGIVPGSVILIGGEPGIGKSTLALQIAASFRALYISGEESPVQVRYRADRLDINPARIMISSNTAVDSVQELIESEKPEIVIIDSVQTLSIPEIQGLTGSVSQIRESTARLVDIAKKNGIPIILIGHITKDGSIAGPRLLEHLVDTVLYFEGDFTKEFRMVRAFKNRFGSVNEIGLFVMTQQGLQEVKNKSTVFVNPYEINSPGNAVSASIEGSRVVLFEVQALVLPTSYSNPRRMADGFDLNRLVLLIAVLERHAKLPLSNFDVFVNVAGGYHIRETSADLAVAAAITSSLKNKAIRPGIGLIAEVSLSGELRPVSQCQRRVQEFGRSGYHSLVISQKDASDAHHVGFNGEIVCRERIDAAIQYLFED